MRGQSGTELCQLVLSGEVVFNRDSEVNITLDLALKTTVLLGAVTHIKVIGWG